MKHIYGARVRVAVDCRQINTNGKVTNAKGRTGTVVSSFAGGCGVQLDDGKREDWTDKPMWFGHEELEAIPEDIQDDGRQMDYEDNHSARANE